MEKDQNDVEFSDLQRSIKDADVQLEQAQKCSQLNIVLDSAYGSLESFSNGQTQKSSSAPGSKSDNSRAEHSSSYEEDSDKAKGGKTPMSQKRKKGKEKSNEGRKISSRSSKNKSIEQLILGLTSPVQSPSPEKKVKIPYEVVENNEDQSCYMRALGYIKKIKERLTKEAQEDFLNKIIECHSSKTSDSVGIVVISLEDGTVAHTSSTVCQALGFPEDMIMGHSFIELIHQKDSIGFSLKLINSLRLESSETCDLDNSNVFYCRFRIFHCLRSLGYGIKNKKRSYKPCKLNLNFKPNILEEKAQGFVVAEVKLIESKYAESTETEATTFDFRHSSSCNFSEYSPEAIRYLGFMPQDLIGNSIFDFYHPDDMPKMKAIYEEIVKNRGKPYRGEDYRFRTFNNSWVTLSTEWLCFVNPWTKKIESIIGQNKVTKNPKDINIFSDPQEKCQNYNEESTKSSQKLQQDILEMLQKPVSIYHDLRKESVIKRRKNMAAEVSPFVQELNEAGSVSLANQIDPKVDNYDIKSGLIVNYNAQSQEQSSVVQAQSCIFVKDPSSHTDDALYQPSSLSDPQLNYNQLNYKETLERFFRSIPKTFSPSDSSKEESKTDTTPKDFQGNSNSESVNPKSSNDASGSGENYKSTSTGSDEGESTIKDVKLLPHYPLTESVLAKHNESMQKQFYEQFSEEAALGSKSRNYKKLKKHKRKHHAAKKPVMSHEEAANALKYFGINTSLADSDSLQNMQSASQCQQNFGNQNIYRNQPTKNLIPPQIMKAPPWLPFSGIPSKPFSADVSKERMSYESTSQSGCLQPRRPALPVHYMSTLPAMMYPAIEPPLVAAPPIMLPNVMYHYTALTSTAAVGVSKRACEDSFDEPRVTKVSKTSNSFDNSGIRLKQATSLTAEPGSIHGSFTPHFERNKDMPSTSNQANFLGQSSKEKDEESPMDIQSKSQVSRNGDKSTTDYTSDALYNSSDILLSMDSSKRKMFTDESCQNTSGDNNESELYSFSGKRKKTRPVLSDPPWLAAVELTHELLFQHQLETRELVDILQQDMKTLKMMNQPKDVEDQLAMLYKELEIDGKPQYLNLEGESSCSDEEEDKESKKSSSYYSRMAALHEENAPIPSPECLQQDHI